jgi:oligogalacturonide lyase
MGKGKVWHDPVYRYIDSVSGREITRLTDYRGHSSHFYFTDPCWLNGDRSFVFTSDRENRSNLFRYDLDTGAITQLTDLDGAGRPGGCVSPANGLLYYWWDAVLRELDPFSLSEREICEIHGPLVPRGRANPTADGAFVCTLLMDVPPASGPRIAYSYSRFREFFLAGPLSQIVRIDIATGRVEIVHEDRCYLGHVNTSPVLGEILTFCHEGPWHEVDQRIWGLNVRTGEAWKIRPQHGECAVGHEYWFADGVRIGYHGRSLKEPGNHVFGCRTWDNREASEVSFPYHSTHFHSLDESLIVGDGTAAFRDRAKPYIQLFRREGEEYGTPRVLAYHRSTFNDQHAHCHPRFTPDGKRVMYTSDLTAYSNIYLVDVGDIEELPSADAV